MRQAQAAGERGIDHLRAIARRRIACRRALRIGENTRGEDKQGNERWELHAHRGLPTHRGKMQLRQLAIQLRVLVIAEERKLLLVVQRLARLLQEIAA